MSWKNLLSFAVVSAFLMNAAVAAPTASLTGVQNGSNYDWTLSFAPDAGLFTTTNLGTGGSLATAFQIEVASGSLVSVGSPTSDFTGGVNPIIDANPGADPYAAGATSEGIQQYSDVASQMGGASNVDALFVPLGSTFFTSGGDKAALSFTTSSDTASYGGLVAQAGAEYTIAADSVTISGPTFPLGDFSGDGKVDSDDLSLLLGFWGDTVPPTPAGWNGSPPTAPLVDSDELSALLGTWGVGVGAGAAVVPEPASVLSLIGFCGLGLVLRRQMK